MDSDLVVDIVKAAPNVCGIKLTCANVGKLTRIMAEVDTSEFAAAYPRKRADIPFNAIDGFIDFLLPSVAVGAGGAISGLPNIAPVCGTIRAEPPPLSCDFFTDGGISWLA